MPRFASKEEYDRWRASQRGDAAAPAPTEDPQDTQPAADPPPADQVYDGPPPGSREFHDRALKLSGLPTDRDKNLAMLCHLTAFLGFLIPFGNIIGPAVVWMVGKSDSEFVADHGKASLNFQISVTLFSIVALVMAVFVPPVLILLIPVIGIVMLYGTVMVIMNSVKAQRGDEGEYALSTHFLS